LSLRRSNERISCLRDFLQTMNRCFIQTVRIAATMRFTQWRHLWNRAQITTRLHRTPVTVKLRTDSTRTRYYSWSGHCVHRIVWTLSQNMNNCPTSCPRIKFAALFHTTNLRLVEVLKLHSLEHNDVSQAVQELADLMSPD